MITRAPLLFDLQAVIFWAHNEVPQALVQRVREGGMVWVSIVSPWEFLLKQKRQSFGIDYEQLQQTIGLLQAEILPIKETHLNRLRSLPVIAKHTDPFDRLLIAQALHEDMTLVGNDRKFPAYQEALSLKLLWEA